MECIAEAGRIAAVAPTVAQLLDKHASRFEGAVIGPVEELDVQPSWSEKRGRHRLLAPIDLQCVKAAGVTFATSTMERVIEERARGDANKAQEIRLALASKRKRAIFTFDFFPRVPGNSLNYTLNP